MIYYSEKLNKAFNTEEECLAAEASFEEKAKAKQLEISKDKKGLADAIEKADEALSEAYQSYDIAYEESKKIIQEAIDKITKLLSPAREKIRTCQQEKYKAISDFTTKYGVYKRVYSSEKAYNELKRFNSLFGHLFLW